MGLPDGDVELPLALVLLPQPQVVVEGLQEGVCVVS